jgi:hypothetical protein
MARIWIAMAAALWGAASAAADSWAAPQEKDYYAVNDAYYLHVVPGDGTQHAHGTLVHVLVGGEEEEAWSRELLNPTAPVEVLVATDGRYVVTLDDWGKVGYGPNVVVIYGPGGELVRNLALEDLLTEEEIAVVPHSASSRWWRGDSELDEVEGVLVLRVVTGGTTAAGKAQTRELRVALAIGEVLPP